MALHARTREGRVSAWLVDLGADPMLVLAPTAKSAIEAAVDFTNDRWPSTGEGEEPVSATDLESLQRLVFEDQVVAADSIRLAAVEPHSSTTVDGF